MSALRYIRVNPAVRSGQPQIVGVPVAVIFNRFEAGEDVESIAEDYGLTYNAVREAVAFEAGRRFTWRKRLL